MVNLHSLLAVLQTLTLSIVLSLTLSISTHKAWANEAEAPKKEDKAKDKNADEPAFRQITWTDLIPKEDLTALMQPPSYINDIEDRSPDDQIGAGSNPNDPYQSALVSTTVIEEMDGQAVKIPGFIVALEFNDEQAITQFYLVPYFGACIHTPPPPPNQIIFVEYPEGLKLDALYYPFWISGVIKTSMVENELGTAAYSLNMELIEEYKY